MNKNLRKFLNQKKIISQLYHERKLISTIISNNGLLIQTIPFFKEQLLHSIYVLDNWLFESKESSILIKQRFHNELNLLFQQNNYHHSIPFQFISKDKLFGPMEDKCPICLDQHIMEDVYTTDCNHHFGIRCYKKWVFTCTIQKQPIKCPCCKKVNPTIHTYRRRVSVIK